MSDQMFSRAAVLDDVLAEVGRYGYRAGLAAVQEIIANDISWQTLLDLAGECGAGGWPSVGDGHEVAALIVDVCGEFGIDAESSEGDEAAVAFTAGYDEGVVAAVGAAVEELLGTLGD